MRRDHRGNVQRMLGTMVDLTVRPFTPYQDRFLGARQPVGALGCTPFHALLGLSRAEAPAHEPLPDDDTGRLLGQLAEILAVSFRQATALP